MLVSIVIRTLNEARYLGDLLEMIGKQELGAGLDCEVVLIDSGSTDDTVDIAQAHGCRITTITKKEFSFGRSLNRGCEFAKGDILVFISGHCVPTRTTWLRDLCQPIMDGMVSYAYGRQVGDNDSNFAERRIFGKYFPEQSQVPQEGFFCNNANSAVLRSAWEAFRFDEELTGLEDMHLAKRLVEADQKVGYVAPAAVFHHHNESWADVRRRFEREAIALQQIMPEVQISRWDVVRYVMSSVRMDCRSALRCSKSPLCFYEILRYRLAQYMGSYAGNHDHRRLSRSRKEAYFYPSIESSKTENDLPRPNRRFASHESQQSES